MARPPLTLAALATAAVPGLEPTGVARHSRGRAGAYDAARICTADGRILLIRVPRSQAAESEQSADLVALRALTNGIRARLPFAVPEFAGQVPAGDTRGIVTDFLDGAAYDAELLTADESLAASIGRSIAALHALPPAFVSEAGLPRRTADEVRHEATRLIASAAETGRLPAALLRRWEEAADDEVLWRFRPTVINGSLDADSILVQTGAVSAIVGWSGLEVGDPARDLHWLLTSRGRAAGTALDAYRSALGGTDEALQRRALLWGELELARWLLHGVASRDDSIVEDAVGLLDGLVERVHTHESSPLSADTGPILAVGEVETLLDRTPRDRAAREAGGSLLTDSYRFSELEGGDRDEVEANLTKPIPLDLDGWGEEVDAGAEAAAQTGADAEAPAASEPSDPERAATDAQAERNSASS
ncbi:phosphotransferase [Agromyces archimandritae]|uniref:Phosphotransferase n=1 Tax=Agromyces archimandritae TaxID=2781962 RepID=A0A975IN78_9MICO|nr:phosphotransferase [Agromyces archimandritae]QTX04280.1 phosphotransferase [Agromyces archimandritae]